MLQAVINLPPFLVKIVHFSRNEALPSLHYLMPHWIKYLFFFKIHNFLEGYFLFTKLQKFLNFSLIQDCIALYWLPSALILSSRKSVQQSPLNWIPAHLRCHLGPPTVADARFCNILLLSTDNVHWTTPFGLTMNQ